MNITQEDLKLLAEWWGEIKEHNSTGVYWLVGSHNNEEIKILLGEPEINELLGLAKYRDWRPHIDSNQLDMLEDKMIKESKVFLMKLFVLDNGAYTVKFRTDTLEDFSFAGDGSTKNEARLNAILNYINEKGVKK